MAYYDGFLAAVRTADKDTYRAFSERSWELFSALGAVSVVETWGDDVPDGKLTSFPLAVKKEEDETVVFSWIEWPDKATRDAGWQRMMSDPDMQMGEMPFDGKRMIFGGFEQLLRLTKEDR